MKYKTAKKVAVSFYILLFLVFGLIALLIYSAKQNFKPIEAKIIYVTNNVVIKEPPTPTNSAPVKNYILEKPVIVDDFKHR